MSGGEALEPELNFVAEMTAFIHGHPALAIEGASDLDHGQFRNSPDPLMADTQPATEFAERELAVRMEAVLERQNLQLAVIEIVQAGHHLLDDLFLAQTRGGID